jgi:zinc protease
MARTKFLLCWVVCLGLLVPFALAQNPKAAPTKSSKITFQDVTLKNGLRVILAEDHSAPTYSIALTYNVGSRDERPGRTGFAHLFEHMMFQGSENVGKGEHMMLVQNNGGDMNGSTNQDRTNYFEMLPANQLDLGLFIEADRMRSLAVTAANLENQRKTVQEERRVGVDNQPYGKTQEVLLDTVYDNFAYKHSTIGSMDDLNAASLEDVQQFFKTYYAPNNAVLTLVGDFKTPEALAKVKKYFGEIPAQPAPKPPDMTEPKQTAERRKSIEDAFAQTTRLDIVYKVPAGNTPDWYALNVMGQVLAGGQSSRLYQKLVKEKELAVSVFGGVQDRRGPSTGSVIAMVRPGKDAAEVEKVIYEEIERLKTEPPADWELQKVRLQMRRQRAQMFRSSLFRAMQVGVYTVYYNDPNLINTMEQKINSVTKDDIQRVARTYLVPTNRSVITTLPKPKAASAAAKEGK